MVPRPAFAPLFAFLAFFAVARVAAGQSAVPAGWETALRNDLNTMAETLTATLKPWDVPARSFPVENYGAVADGATVSTQALQKAIDACSAAGGGTVLLAKGDYVTGHDCAEKRRDAGGRQGCPAPRQHAASGLHRRNTRPPHRDGTATIGSGFP